MTTHSHDSTGLPRRNFLKTSASLIGATGLAGLAQGCKTLSGGSSTGASGPLVGPNQVILFQGDSITDAGRSRAEAGTPNNQAALGNGYAWMAASQLLVDMPASGLQIYNRGISGNKVFQLADRWQTDCLDLKPDLLSILIGVNDIWHKLNGQYDGTVEVYERDYRALLDRTRKALPNIKLVVCEPFVLRCGAVNDKWFPAFEGYRAAARRVAESFQAVFVPFQLMFDQAIQYAPPEHWAKDGVHPSAYGASLMAHNWLKAVLHRRPV